MVPATDLIGMLQASMKPSATACSLSPLSTLSKSGYNTAMESTKYIYWQDENHWLGYLQEYPDYWTQGESLEDLQAHLRDLYRDLTSGEIPGVRKLAELALQ